MPVVVRLLFVVGELPLIFERADGLLQIGHVFVLLAEVADDFALVCLGGRELDHDRPGASGWSSSTRYTMRSTHPSMLARMLSGAKYRRASAGSLPSAHASAAIFSNSLRILGRRSAM